MPGRSQKVLGNAVTHLWALPTTVISYLIFGSSQKHSCFLAPSTDPRGDLERNDPLQGLHRTSILPPFKVHTSLRKCKKRQKTGRPEPERQPVLLNLFFSGGGVGKLTLRPQDKKRLKTKHLPSGAWDSQGGVLPFG